MVFIQQNFENGRIFTPFDMNYMENAIDTDLLVVKVNINDDAKTITVDTTYDVVKKAISDGRLVIYMVYYSDGEIQECFAKNSEDGIKFGTTSSTAYFIHREDDSIESNDSGPS